jgi:hypothetical protein
MGVLRALDCAHPQIASRLRRRRICDVWTLAKFLNIRPSVAHWLITTNCRLIILHGEVDDVLAWLELTFQLRLSNAVVRELLADGE